ncbi:MAG: hypothetical protein JWM96_1156 [Alphaproteobacteria bacterium]|nr:hypothetical protein [Alphaproteobacteria bacterium]
MNNMTDMQSGNSAAFNNGAVESSVSAVSWQAILAGAFAAIAVSMVLLLVGSALGFAAMSPWSDEGASATAISIGMIAWMVIMQWASSALGGYIAGRLRTKWANTHGDEVFFRDTAHGFMSWAVATVVTAAFLASGAAAVVAGGAKAATTVAAAGAAGAANGASDNGGMASSMDPTAYFIDSMFRSDRPAPTASNAEVTAEVSRIIARDIKEREFPEGDRNYLARVVSARTGLNQADAQARVDQTVEQIRAAETQAREAADKARKTAATVSILTAISMILGAFFASLAAVLGGRCRDYDDTRVSTRNNA